ncbi:hypothetical protein GJ496_002313 [Pomphorhynchus laevis]|nr:hypothetical protein GJ496_002313 [Pomphorhynchus laevis]
MIKDRLAALKAAQQLKDGDDAVLTPSETTIPVAGSQNRFMLEFFEQVDDLRNNIDKIAELVANVKILHNEILSSPQADQRTKGALEEQMAEIKRCANDVRRKLKGLRKDDHVSVKYHSLEQHHRGWEESEPLLSKKYTAKSEKLNQLKHTENDQTNTGSSGQVYVSAYERMRGTQLVTLNIRFNEIMAEYNSEQTRYRDGCKKQIQRQLQITGRATTSDELEEMLESGNPAIFTKGIVIEAQDARRTLAEIEARHNDIIKLEASIRELHDMFIDMAMLVESQGEMIDRIEYNVNQSVNYIDSAKTDTRKAVKYQSAARKKKVIISFVVIIIILVIILVLISVFRK